ncbi:proton-dependent oligopeptide transporter, POT family [Entomortierella parvispora]|uniref:Proton-dependent oligopeptide transporter, POT family n=1 Tax=Entomortierella parvispora TaxID=205924 RepID=A0A9P3HCJ5_9FUNG|nr:proton-dependent oligopeptide transporter, POT family [Entomortierella parvispora]
MKREYDDDTTVSPAVEMAYKSDPMMAAVHSSLHPHNKEATHMTEVIEGDGREPTLEEESTLRRVADHIPASAWLVVVVEFCERFTYYGLSGPFQNYIQYPYTSERGAEHPGAIGKGQQTATALNYFFQFFCYVTPILGAIVADQYLGKYKTICVFCGIYMLGVLVLTLTSIPVAILHGAALPGLVIAMVIIGLGTGGIKANVSPMVAEQYTGTKPTIKTLETGEKVIVDPNVTVQSIFNWFYWSINLGSLSAIITTNAEKYYAFWLAYLIPLLMFNGAVLALWWGKDKVVKTPPRGSVLLEAFRVFGIAMKNGNNLDAAKPSEIQARMPESDLAFVTWDDVFIDELRLTLKACSVFCFFPLYWVIYNQITTNLTSQAGTMLLYGIPNDVVNNIDPIVLIIFIPIFDKIVYPGFRRMGLELKPVTRISLGFLFAAIAMAWTAIVQHKIYITGPNYACTLCDPNQTPNNVSIAWQILSYFFIAISEIFASITGLEFAFTNAPATMKSVVMSIFLFMNCAGALLGFAFLPLTKDPLLLWMYTGLGVAAFIISAVIYYLFRDYDKTMIAEKLALQAKYDARAEKDL